MNPTPNVDSRYPFRVIQPYFLSGLLDDPILFIRQRVKGQNILVDCGNIEHIAKKSLKTVGTVLITHAHMDHFIGFDHFIRAALVTGKLITVIGPAGIGEKIESRLKGYDWNLSEDFFVSLNIREIHTDHISVYHADGHTGFILHSYRKEPKPDSVFWETSEVKISGVILDHHIDTLAFKITEKSPFSVDQSKIQKLGITSGYWINELKRNLSLNVDNLLSVFSSNMFVNHLHSIGITNNTDLYEAIRKDDIESSVAYITDSGGSKENLDILAGYFQNVALMFCECAFLSDNKAKARQSRHLCVDDINWLLKECRPRYFIPTHLSKTYMTRVDELYEAIRLPSNCSMITIPDHVSPAPLALESYKPALWSIRTAAKN